VELGNGSMRTKETKLENRGLMLEVRYIAN